MEQPYYGKKQNILMEKLGIDHNFADLICKYTYVGAIPPRTKFNLIMKFMMLGEIKNLLYMHPYSEFYFYLKDLLRNRNELINYTFLMGNLKDDGYSSKIFKYHFGPGPIRRRIDNNEMKDCKKRLQEELDMVRVPKSRFLSGEELLDYIWEH